MQAADMNILDQLLKLKTLNKHGFLEF